MKQIDKEYGRPFLIEATKLTRLVDKIHERLGEHQHTTPLSFAATFSGAVSSAVTASKSVL